MRTGRVTESPTSWATLSISMTSPTATFCCWPPLRTIAYTTDSLSSSDNSFGLRLGTLDVSPVGRRGCRTRRRRTWAPRAKSTDGGPAGQNGPARADGARSALARALLLDRHVGGLGRVTVDRRLLARDGGARLVPTGGYVGGGDRRGRRAGGPGVGSRVGSTVGAGGGAGLGAV